MGFANFLAEEYGVGALMETFQETYPPANVFINALGDSTFPEAVDKWATAHAEFAAKEPPSPDFPWSTFRHRLIVENPAVVPLCALLTAMGVTDIAGISVDDFLKALVSWKQGQKD